MSGPDQYRGVAECVVAADQELARDLIGAIHHLTESSPSVVTEPRLRLWALQSALRDAIRPMNR